VSGPCLVKSEAGNWWRDNNGRIEPSSPLISYKERISFLINPKFTDELSLQIFHRISQFLELPSRDSLTLIDQSGGAA
jgi:hypothetical protein